MLESNFEGSTAHFAAGVAGARVAAHAVLLARPNVVGSLGTMPCGSPPR